MASRQLTPGLVVAIFSTLSPALLLADDKALVDIDLGNRQTVSVRITFSAPIHQADKAKKEPVQTVGFSGWMNLKDVLRSVRHNDLDCAFVIEEIDSFKFKSSTCRFPDGIDPRVRISAKLDPQYDQYVGGSTIYYYLKLQIFEDKVKVGSGRIYLDHRNTFN
ncbi:MAG: hypothetical protein V1495_02050 [Pseudomonadota bacterium]